MKLKSRVSGDALFDLVIQMTNQLINHGIPESKAAMISSEVAKFFGHHWSGTQLYFSSKGLSIKQLEADIPKLYDGSRATLCALAKKHGVSDRVVYQLIAEMRQREKQQRTATSTIAER